MNPSAIQYEYPGLFAREDTADFANFFAKKGSQEDTTFSFFLLDKMPEGITAKEDLSPCARLTYEQKSQLLKDMFVSVLRTAGEFQFIEGKLAGNLVLEGWYHLTEINKLIADGVIDAYISLGYLSSYIKTKSLEVDIVSEVFVDKLMGVICNLQFSLQNCIAPIQLSVSTIPPAVSDSFAPCCK